MENKADMLQGRSALYATAGRDEGDPMEQGEGRSNNVPTDEVGTSHPLHHAEGDDDTIRGQKTQTRLSGEQGVGKENINWGLNQPEEARGRAVTPKSMKILKL
jgi:hypothetical protein